MEKLTKVLLSCVLVSSSMFALTLVSNEKTVSAAAEDLNLVYQLDFEDASNLGKNSVSSSYADATVYQTEGHMSQVDRSGGKAIRVIVKDGFLYVFTSHASYAVITYRMPNTYASGAVGIRSMYANTEIEEFAVTTK